MRVKVNRQNKPIILFIFPDIANPKSNVKNPGFSKEEREKFTELLDVGFVDSFRHLYPDEKDVYTFWSFMGTARERNIGWYVYLYLT